MTHTAEPLAAEGAPPELSTLAQRYLQAQLDGDRRRALALIVEEGVKRGHPVADLHLRVIQPAQQEIGRLWQRNEITVAQEHLATAISQLVVAHLYQYIRRGPPNGKLVVVACPAGELHELGARMAADFLEVAGFAVHYLGANVPVDDLVRMVVERRPALLVLSAATTLCFPGLRSTLERVRAAAPELPILVGGNAFIEGGTCDVPDGVIAGARDATELVTTAREVLRL